MKKSKFISRSEIPEVLIPGFIEYISYSGIEVSYKQTSFLRSKWEEFKDSLGTLPAVYGTEGSDFILDTEFTDLKNGKPISIAVVNTKSPSESFYVELNDTYATGDCSDFVNKSVLPYLEGNLAECSRLEASERIIEFLSSYPQPWRLWSDCPPLDIVQLNYILSPLSYTSCSLRDMDYMVATCYVDYSRRAPEFSNYRAHHALDDAKRYAITWDKISNGLDAIRNDVDSDISPIM